MNIGKIPVQSKIDRVLQKTSKSAVRLPLTVIPATGLFPGEFLHLHEDWISWPTDLGLDHPIITVPPVEECRRKTKNRGRRKHTAGIVEEERVCPACRRDGREQYKSPTNLEEPRSIPVVDKRAAGELRYWFQEYNTIPWNKDMTAVQTAAKEIIGERISLGDLRRAFVQNALQIELDEDIMLDNLGLKQKNSAILEYERRLRQADRLTYQNYLAFIEERTHVTEEQIQEGLDRSRHAVKSMLDKLVQRNMVRRVEKEKKTLCYAVVGAATMINCPEEQCDREFDTFGGASSHRERVHDDC